MPFVKLDCGILDSTLWFDKPCRDVFLTALLMAEPYETTEPLDQLEINTLEKTGWIVPMGWYGFVRAAGVGIISRAKLPEDEGLAALTRLGSPEMQSRTADYDGRRLVRVTGGFLVLNYMRYRERDYTSAERQKRYRERLALHRHSNALQPLQGDSDKQSRDKVTQKRHVTRNITQAEAEAEAEVRTHTLTRAREKKGHHGHAFCGRFCVPGFLHDEFTENLGDKASTFDLLAWYVAVEQATAKELVVSDALGFWRDSFKAELRNRDLVERRYGPPMTREESKDVDQLLRATGRLRGDAREIVNGWRQKKGIGPLPP